MGTAPTGTKPTTEYLEVGPQLACDWLEANTHNRPVRDDQVASLARDMRAGRWHTTGDSVKFDTNGVLIDGQHRLWAIIEANVTVPMMVVYGLDPSAQDYIDIGRRRTTADALHLRGRGEYSGIVSSIARGVLLVRHPSDRPTQAEVLALVEAEEEVLVAGARLAKQAQKAGLRGGSIYGIAFHHLCHVDPVAAPRFFDALISGESLPAGSPILALRRRFLTTPPRLGTGSSSTRINLAYVIKAWNFWRSEKSIVALRYSLDEPMPVAK